MGSLAEELQEAMARRFDQYMTDLRALTSIDCPSGHKPGLDEVTHILRRMFDEMGGSVEVVSNVDTGDDIVATFAGSGEGKLLLLCHTDTVYPTGTVAAHPFRLEGGRALAPGIADMKSGLLSAAYAVKLLSDVNWVDFERVVILCNSDEEAAPRHSVELIQEQARHADAVFCMEAGRANGDIVSSRKGVLVFRIEARGREAHAGVNPDAGRNAIVALADRILEIWKLNGKYPGLGVSPGKIVGGTAVNTVPAECVCEIDIRVARADDIPRVERDIHSILKTSIIPDVSFEATNAHTMPPMEESPGSHRLVALAKQAAKELAFDVNDTFTGGGSDGAYAAAAGASVLDGLGPVGGGAHSEREYIEIGSIVPRTAMLARLMTLTCSRSS